MNCKDFQERWVDHLDHSLPAHEEREWEAHCKSCGSCREEIESLGSLQKQLREISPVDPLPPAFWNQQLSSIREKIERTPRRKWSRFLESLFQPRRAFALATVVLAIFAGYQYTSHRFSRIGSQKEWASKVSSEENLLPFSDTEDIALDLNEEQLGQYYAYLAEKYLPSEMDDSEENNWIEGLNNEELDQAIKYFEQDSIRRTL
jgi:hypothetical protein